MAVRTRRLASLSILALLLSAAFAACGDDGTAPWRFQKVIITPNGFFPGGRGATSQFEVGMVNNLGDPIPTEGFHWSWSSSNPAVISIDQNGLATAAGIGSAQIRAQNAGLEGTVTVSVSQVPTRFTIVEGNNQSAVVGTQLANQVVLKLVDAGGLPMGGLTVEFSASGGGLAGLKSAVTGADGIVKTTWILGTKTSEKQALTATMGSVTKEITATPLAEAPTGTIAAGLVQDGWGLEALDTTLAVVIHDRFGNPVTNEPVTWTVLSGGGTLAPSAAKTNAAGRATAAWTLGATTSAQTARAEVAGLPEISFAATAKANPIISGTVQIVAGLQAPLARAKAVPTPRRSAPVAPEYVPGEWIVTFDPAAVGAGPSAAPGFQSPAAVAAVQQSIQARVAALDGANSFSIRGISPATGAARIRVEAGSDFDAVGQRLRSQPGVLAVERNQIVRSSDPAPGPTPAPAVSISDPGYPLQAWDHEMIGLDQAWKITTGSSAIIVAVVDDGIRATHADLAGNLTNDGYDFVSDNQVPVCAGSTMSNADDGGGPDSDPTIPAEYDVSLGCVGNALDIGGHGIHVAGTIGATAGATGTVGVSQKVKIRPIRVIGAAYGTSYDIAQGILYAAGLPADNGTGTPVTAPSRAAIINLSIGGPGFTTIEANAVHAASAAGSLLIAAAGNEGDDQPNYPAAFPEVLSVAAVGPTGSFSSYSSWGPTIDIAAPGGDSDGGLTHEVFSTYWNFSTNTSSWGYAEGTSMAAPHVSGVAALILAQEPTLTAAQLRQRLLDYAVPAGDAQYYGAGIVNAFTSLTKGAGFPQRPFVRLVNAVTGETVQTVAPSSNGSFRFAHLPVGTKYRVFGGTDESGDGVIGTLGRPFGFFGGAAGSIVEALATEVYQAPFSIGVPNESGSNSSMFSADAIPVGGYVNARLDTDQQDWFAVTVPAGTYTFGTTGLKGACGLAGQANTRIRLFGPTGSQLGTNDDGVGFDYCAKLTQTLAAGTYSILVTGSSTVPFGEAGQTGGTYRFYVRSGS